MKIAFLTSNARKFIYRKNQTASWKVKTQTQKEKKSVKVHILWQNHL